MPRHDAFTLALDAMGGDHAPDAVIKGASIVALRYPKMRFLFFGDQAQIEAKITRNRRLKKRSDIIHTDSVVAAEEKPSIALRKGRESSMWKAIQAVAEGKADAIVSGGNTGALMAMSKLILGSLPGIQRPAIASLMPTLHGDSVMLDLGANLECNAEQLFQFAIMGDAFARAALGLESPSLGLLNVGSEEMKGHESLREAHRRLRENRIGLNFYGFVEGDDIAKGTVDVVVTDGFTGNVALKTIEGTGQLVNRFLKRVITANLRSRLGYFIARAAFKKLKQQLDPQHYNGAVFLGLGGIVVKSHGGAQARGMANAIALTADTVIYGTKKRVIEELAALDLRAREQLQPEIQETAQAAALAENG